MKKTSENDKENGLGHSVVYKVTVFTITSLSPLTCCLEALLGNYMFNGIW